MSAQAPHVMFVCWGNICRSPMAEMVARSFAVREEVTKVRFTSSGVSAEEQGHPMDPRAVAVLEQAGYPISAHTAHKVTAAEILDADLVIGMEALHLGKLRQIVPTAKHLYLLTDFDPDASPGSEIEDPWYGEPGDFLVTLHQIEAAMPEVMKRARELLG